MKCNIFLTISVSHLRCCGIVSKQMQISSNFFDFLVGASPSFSFEPIAVAKFQGNPYSMGVKCTGGGRNLWITNMKIVGRWFIHVGSDDFQWPWKVGWRGHILLTNLYRACQRSSAQNNFANFSRTVERYDIKSYILVTNSVIHKSGKIHYITYRIGKIMLLLAMAT